jgi:pimeloyl-ACP methyl ester carboxylesterase
VQTHYTKSADGTSLAYQVLGESGPVVLFVPGAISNLMLADAQPAAARFYERLSRFCRLVRFDKRGTGLSDRGVSSTALADQVDDVEAIRSAVGADEVILMGLSQGAAVSILFATRSPERVAKLILLQGLACDASDPDAPPAEAVPLIDWEEFFRDLDSDFTTFSRRLAEIMFPGASGDLVDLFTDFLRASASPQSLRSLWQGIVGLDLRPLLPELHVPTLVLHSRGDRHHPVAHGRYLAAHIREAKYVELESDVHVVTMDGDCTNEIVAAVEDFVTGTVRHAAERRFAAILFADIVDSTAKQTERGDRGWRDRLGAWEQSMGRVVDQFSGRIVKFQGDGVMAVFGSAGDALRAAKGAIDASAGLGLTVRAGVHAGEAYEVDGDLFGTCINIAARVCGQAKPGEVLTTAVVEGLVEGSDLRFENRGESELKGIGKRRVSALV